MWERVGLDDTEERVYRAMTRRRARTPEDYAAELGVPAADVAAALDQLSTAGLAVPDGDGTFAAIDPRVGLGALIRHHRFELDRLQNTLDRLADDYRDSRLSEAPGQRLEVIHSAEAIALRVADLLTGTEHELLTLVAPPFLDPQDDSLEPMVRLLQRRVTCRAVHTVHLLSTPAGLAQARRLTDAGEQIRVLPSVPVKLIVSDRRRALMPLAPQTARSTESALVIGDAALLDALVALFEALWERGAPFSDDPRHDGDRAAAASQGPDPQLLSLLALGLRDEAVARHLGISERSVRRRTAALMGELGAASRFQAGLAAGRLGWL
ncbi:hypothetical protein BIV57_01150 [Mangrovactinospora gilvigrisea]|uniref:HTH luxR-type domain-containing protein n=1 Tax=Mangrovactinospora gilvigrisea TaxID=1428644 RepID=A0A1J7BLE5_9ACTN|nr:hypothetical protein [Mangrovactinospora gilvigrisea]OIV39470.1 hypothetical protein BIV57_01150 [Mangrovactinospora gilvigrisea]